MQVDSHCRFAPGWDTLLLAMMEQAANPRSIFSTYATPFEPQSGPADEVLTGGPLQMALQGFTLEGIPHMRPLGIHNWQELRRPLRARFVSAGFLFAPGSFVTEVPYDPELYFLGEEVSMTLRAFTHGYDLYHPCVTIVWHDYVRRNGVRHWDDHTEANQASDKAGALWGERDVLSRSRVGQLLAGQFERTVRPGNRAHGSAV